MAGFAGHTGRLVADVGSQNTGLATHRQFEIVSQPLREIPTRRPADEMFDEKPFVSTICSRRRFVRSAFLFLTGAAGSGCGTILYPERRGQPAGRLDWGVVALDGIGLILFFVPGVVAFAVDFATGAIYLPHYGYGAIDSEQPSRLRRIDIPGQRLTRAGIARTVSQAMGQTITLDPETYQTCELTSLDAFWNTWDGVAANCETESARVLRGQSPVR